MSPISSNVGHIWSWVRELNSKKTKPSGHPYTPPHKQKELPKPVDTSSQVSTLDDAEMVEVSLDGVPTTISPIAMTTRI